MEDIEEDRRLVYGRNESIEDIEEDRRLVYGRNESMEDIEDLIYVLEAYISSAILHL